MNELWLWWLLLMLHWHSHWHSNGCFSAAAAVGDSQSVASALATAATTTFTAANFASAALVLPVQYNCELKLYRHLQISRTYQHVLFLSCKPYTG